MNGYLYFLLTYAVCKSHGCIFKYNHREKLESKEEYYMKVQAKQPDFPRILSDTNCECGIDYDIYNIKKPWMLYIHFKVNQITRTCPGTIINSNMVITSHKCLMKSNKMEMKFPIVVTKALDLPNKDELNVSTHIDPKSTTATVFKISKVIYRNEFPAEMVIKNANAPESDVVIIVIKDVDFNRDEKFVPICVPNWNEIPIESMLNKEGFYQGVRGWDFYEFKYPAGVGNFTSIMKAEECNKLSGKYVSSGSDNTICINFIHPGPTTEGGPMRLISTRWIHEEGPSRSFLIGLATHVDHSMENAHQKYAYFFNINSNVKYIEEKANAEKSEWCSSASYSEVYPWEYYTKGQSETLDCECGVQELYKSNARVFGGKDAKPYEFPWIIQVSSLDVKKDVNGDYQFPSKLCAGSLINDKVILTAASCLVSATNAKLKGNNLNILDHKNIAETIGSINPITHDQVYLVYIMKHYSSDYDPANNLWPPAKLEVEKIIFHPMFAAEIQHDRISFDIALIILKENITEYLAANRTEEGRDVTQICLPEIGNFDTFMKGKHRKGTVAGWGGAEPLIRQPAPQVITKADVEIYPIEFCNSHIRTFKKDPKNLPMDLVICSGGDNTTKTFQTPGPYKGDSGAPLMIRDEAGKFTQFGVFSNFQYLDYDVEDGDYVFEGISYYVNVEPFLPFINYYSNLVNAQSCKRNFKRQVR